MNLKRDPCSIPSDLQWERLWKGRFPVYLYTSTGLYLTLLFGFYIQENQVGGAATTLFLGIHRALDLVYVFDLYFHAREQMTHNYIPDQNELIGLLNEQTPVLGLGVMLLVQIIVMVAVAHVCSPMARASFIFPSSELQYVFVAVEPPMHIVTVSATEVFEPKTVTVPSQTQEPVPTRTPVHPRTVAETIEFANREQVAALLVGNPDLLKRSLVWMGEHARREVLFQTSHLLDGAIGIKEVVPSFEIAATKPLANGWMLITTVERWNYCVVTLHTDESPASYIITQVYEETYLLKPVVGGYVIERWTIIEKEAPQARDGCPSK